MSPPRRRLSAPARTRWPRRTARLRLTAAYGGLLLLSGVVLVAITYVRFEQATQYTAPQLPRVPHAPALQQLHTPSVPSPFAAEGVGQPPGVALSRALPRLTYLQQQFAQEQNRLTVTIPSPGPGNLGRGLQAQLTQDQHQLARDQLQLTAALRQLAQAVRQVAQTGPIQKAQRASDSHQLLVNSGIALAIVSVLALLGGWLVAGRILRPIRTITRKARRISSTSLHERLALDGPQDELKDLGDTLDELFGRLDAAFEAQRRFVANASHELRTPITAERNLLQVALDDPDTSAEAWRTTATELLASNDEQKHLIEALLTLASSEGGLDHREAVELSGIAGTVLLEADGDFDRLGLRIEATLEAAPVEGDPQLLERLIANLLDNAVSHNVEGGSVEVFAGTRDGVSVFAVSNTGPVIPATEIERLFQPFQRLDPRRLHHDGGHGVGLSIVHAIATAHGATIAARPLPEGGMAIEVAFPGPAHADPPRAISMVTGHPAVAAR